jgi:hypothetical protein
VLPKLAVRNPVDVDLVRQILGAWLMSVDMRSMNAPIGNNIAVERYAVGADAG